MKTSSRTPHSLLMLSSVAASAVIAGCSTEADHPPGVQNRVALTAFESCEALETYIEDTAVQQMKSYVDGSGYYRGGVPVLEAGTDTQNAAPPAGPDAYTTTNVQVQGVDEADFTKNNGTHIFTLSGNRLYITQSWPADQMRRIADLELEGHPYQMFFDDDRDVIVALGTVFAPYANTPQGATIDCLAYRGGCGYYAPATKVTTIDVSNPAAPTVTNEQYLPGWHQNSRRVDGAIRVVLSDSFQLPPDIRYAPEYEPGLYEDEARLAAAREQLIAQNEPIIRARTLRDWLPYGQRRLADGTLVDLPYDCGDFHQVDASVGLGFTSVATINLDRPDQSPSLTAIIASTNEVYASQTSLYLATRHWWWWPEPGQTDHTYIFKFDITDPNRARFVAGGGVDGHILNQFSLDEHKGYLRVATTINRATNPLEPWEVETTNRVAVLGENAGALSVVGTTDEVAPGERIQSARFIGDRGYVVTFRQVDPLYTIDLSNPTAPSIVGELKVPGFSSYIHPLDENHLLTIGIHIPEPDQNGQANWEERHMKLTIFDVSDFADPQEKFVEPVGTAHGWSEAAWDHKAFNFFAERGLLAIPFSDYNPRAGDYWASFVSDLRVFSVDAAAGIRSRGALTMSDLYQTHEYDGWSWYWSPWVRRSVMASDAGQDFVYAISDAGIRVAELGGLSTPLATAPFDLMVRTE